MSGGSWNYVYSQIQDVADRLQRRDQSTDRRALGALLELAAKALHDIEWVDSCDYGEGDDLPAIRACLTREQRLDAATDAARQALADLRAVLDEVES